MWFKKAILCLNLDCLLVSIRSTINQTFRAKVAKRGVE